MTSLDVAFAAVGLIAAASGLLAVTTRHVVHAALWLVVCLGSVAGCYLVLGAELVNREVSTGPWHRALAAVLAAGVTGLLAAALLPLAGGEPVDRVETASDAMARQVFGTWVWPFELLSLLLLVALVAALAVARMTSAPGADGAAVRGDASERVLSSGDAGERG